MSTSAPAFDVFISYRQREPDMTWVRDNLVATLRASGVKVFIDVEQFRLGQPLISEMARAVEQSNYTLAVVTPTYMESQFTEFENLISQQLGLELAQQKLFIVMREKCSLPLRLRYKIWLSMTNDQEVADNMPKLISAIQGLPID